MQTATKPDPRPELLRFAKSWSIVLASQRTWILYQDFSRARDVPMSTLKKYGPTIHDIDCSSTEPRSKLPIYSLVAQGPLYI